MPVLAVTVIFGLDPVTYDGIATALGPALVAASGFRTHAAESSSAGMVVTEVWDSADAFRAFYDEHVAANLPPGTEPEVRPLHRVMIAS